jgi:RNA polymerase sigma-70 factor (ECF subfamily)
MNQDVTPEALLRRAVAGDEDAFRVLYRQLSGGIFRFALHMAGNPSLAEDVTQEVFLVLIRDPGRFDPSRASLKAFLYGVARNHTLRALEKESRFAPYLERGTEPAGEAMEDSLRAAAATVAIPPGIAASLRQDSVPDASDDLIRREEIGRVRRAVLALPPVYREAVVLCDLQELSYEEAAQSLECAPGTLRSRLHRGREMLAERLRAAQRNPGRASAVSSSAAKEERR